MPITFAYPQLLLLALLAVPALWLAYRRRRALGHTQVGMHSNVRSVPILGRLPQFLIVAFFVLAALAMSRPQLPDVGEKEVIITRDFIIAVDISGSMQGQISDPDQIAVAGEVKDATGQPVQQVKRIQLAEKAISLFVKEREGDRVALFMFDTSTYYSWPLSKDLRVIELKNVGRTGTYNGGGTDFSGDSGPIPAAIDHFKELGQAQSKVLIMVTDGEDSIQEERMQQLLQALTAGNIKIYTLAIGWSNPNAQNDLRKITEATGGQVIVVGNGADMKAGFQKISELEKSRVEVEKTVSYRDIYQFPLIAAVLALCLFLVAAALVREDA
jgi:Ca-activated chloride channel family protein